MTNMTMTLTSFTGTIECTNFSFPGHFHVLMTSSIEKKTSSFTAYILSGWLQARKFLYTKVLCTESSGILSVTSSLLQVKLWLSGFTDL